MAKGGYNGGSTLIRIGSNWFSKSTPTAIKKKPVDRSEAFLKRSIEQAAAKLARTQSDFDSGRLKPKPPEPIPKKMGKKKRKKLKLAAKRAKNNSK